MTIKHHITKRRSKPGRIGNLAEIGKIDFTDDKSYQVKLSPDGRLWVNTPYQCVLRIQGIPQNTLVSYIPEANFLDITILL